MTHDSRLTPHASLDARWLSFAAEAGAVFARYPQMEPMRLFIFKELLTQGIPHGPADTLKHWLRPLMRRDRTAGPFRQADALLWIESRREEGLGLLLPVERALKARGIDTLLVSYEGPASLTEPALRFRSPARGRVPGWAHAAWRDLCEAVPALRKQAAAPFYYASANIQSLQDEIRRVLDGVRPKITLSASTQLRGGSSLALVSQKCGATSMLLQHGILQAFYTPIVTDYMLTWGPSSDRFLIDLGVPPQKLIAVGSPKHDSMFPSPDGVERGRLLEALALPDRPTFVFFSNGNDLVRNGCAPIECARWLETMAATYAERLNVVVRLHPNEDGSLYAECPHVKVVKGVPDLATALGGSDWVASLCSTVLYEGLLYRKPVWQFFADGWPELADNWKTGLATRIASEDDLLEQTERILRPGAERTIPESLLDQVYTNHGRAAEAVADFVECTLTGAMTTDR